MNELPVRPVITDEGTRGNILSMIVEEGPITASTMARKLHLTPAAVRRHLTQLESNKLIEVHDTPGGVTPRRGRPSRYYVATDEGRATMVDMYSDFATHALQFIREQLGDIAVEEFVEERIQELERRYAPVVEKAGDSLEARVRALATALNDDGYAASTRAVGPVGFAVQLCQGHCPIKDVAEQFPEVCEQELHAFARLLGVHVQRLATLAGGDHVCTTHIPLVIPTSSLTTGPRALATSDTDSPARHAPGEPRSRKTSGGTPLTGPRLDHRSKE